MSTLKESWAVRRAWGTDVFVVVECPCGKASGHSSASLVGKRCEVPCHCPCGHAWRVTVNVADALGRAPVGARTIEE